jgi:hypothetical protein
VSLGDIGWRKSAGGGLHNDGATGGVSETPASQNNHIFRRSRRKRQLDILGEMEVGYLRREREIGR